MNGQYSEANPHHLRHAFSNKGDIGFRLLRDLLDVVYSVDERDNLGSQSDFRY
jgi:hypothetical protein